MEPPPQPPRQAIPKDGLGPRGLPETYHTARVLESTARYERFIRKLRNLEEEQRRGAINTEKDLKDKQYSDFFIRCDRRSLINNVARRVDLCLTSYQEDLEAKRRRLTALLTAEEEKNIRMFVEQAQAGAEAVWQGKKDRLAYLLAKRQKEHEDKYSDVPISKCVHVHPCIVKMRAAEAAEGQLYQMKENIAKKMSEIELDKMWHEVALKESEALAARMEYDAIDRLRRAQECAQHGQDTVARKKEQRRREQEMLKQEAKKMKELYEEAKKREQAEEEMQRQKKLQEERALNAILKEQQEAMRRQREEEQLTTETWESLSYMGINDERDKAELRRKKQKELVVCNERIVKLSNDRKAMLAAGDELFDVEAKRLQEISDQKRCRDMMRSKKINDEARAGVIEQIKENAAARDAEAEARRELVQYQNQLAQQLQQLVQHNELTEAQARKLFQSQLLEQIKYNKLLKERQEIEELEQRKKFARVTEDYQNEIVKILCRVFFSDEIHPFLRKMYSGLKMQETCPCSKPTYCAVPVRAPKPDPKASQKTKPSEKKGPKTEVVRL